MIEANQGRYQTIKIYRPLLSSSLAVLLMACGSNSGPPEPVDLSDNTASKREWYCYGEPISGEWRCGSEEDNSQIVPISSLEKDTTPLISKPAQNEKIELSTTNDELQSSKSVAEANKSLNPYSLDGQYIRDQPRENYTIQVMALADKEKLVQFAKDRNLGPALIAHTVSRGSEWYVLLLDIYPNFNLAKKARQVWMETNPKLSEAWIRALGPLQDSLVGRINRELSCDGEQIGGDSRCGNEEDNSQIAPISSREKGTTPLISKLALNKKIELSSTNDELQSPESGSEANKSLNSYSWDGQDIRDLPRKYYTIQVVAQTNKGKLVQFAKDRNLDPTLTAHTVSQGSEWHVLLLGIYPNFALAKKARQAWMETNPEYPEPWIRALGPLQDSLVEGINKKKE